MAARPKVLLEAGDATEVSVAIRRSQDEDTTVRPSLLKGVRSMMQNMNCSVCPITVRKALERVSGVTSAEIDFDRKTAKVTYDPDRVNPVGFTQTAMEAGYPSTLHPKGDHEPRHPRVRYHVSTMRLCQNGN